MHKTLAAESVIPRGAEVKITLKGGMTITGAVTVDAWNTKCIGQESSPALRVTPISAQNFVEPFTASRIQAVEIIQPADIYPTGSAVSYFRSGSFFCAVKQSTGYWNTSGGQSWTWPELLTRRPLTLLAGTQTIA